LLQTGTFKIADGAMLVHRSSNPQAYFKYKSPGSPSLPANAIAQEVLVKDVIDGIGASRYSSHVYWILLGRPGAGEDYYAWGSAFNGSLAGADAGEGHAGGAAIQELSKLLSGDGLQTELLHELGHAFGLVHSDCHGYPMGPPNDSIMSYNGTHDTKGLQM